MARNYHLIDGYNVMHAAGLARVRYARGDLERCRNRLLLKLSELLTEDERQRTTIVFDAREAPPGSIRRHIYREMCVEFAEPGTEADDHIEILISNHSASRQLLLVSSDHRLQRAVKRRHGRSIDSEEFLRIYTQRELLRDHEHRPNDESPPPPLSQQKDLEFWLGEFDDVDPRKILRELPKEISESKFLPAEEHSQTAPVTTPSKPELEPSHERTRWEQEVDELQELLDDPQRMKRWIDESDMRQH